jgi:hypothetical protein
MQNLKTPRMDKFPALLFDQTRVPFGSFAIESEKLKKIVSKLKPNSKK